MYPTAVAVVGNKNPDWLKDIRNISSKWQKQTEGLEDAWPEGGTFDVEVCESMERRIRDYKPKDKSKRRQGKKYLELKFFVVEIIQNRRPKLSSKPETRPHETNE